MQCVRSNTTSLSDGGYKMDFTLIIVFLKFCFPTADINAINISANNTSI